MRRKQDLSHFQVLFSTIKMFWEHELSMYYFSARWLLASFPSTPCSVLSDDQQGSCQDFIELMCLLDKTLPCD